MSKKILLPVAAVLIFGGILAPPAQAQPGVAEVICNAIDDNPSVATVTELVTDLVQAGASPYQAGQVIAESVIHRCTRNIPVLDRFIAYYQVGRGETA